MTNVKMIQMNARSNKQIDHYLKQPGMSETDARFLDKIVRPYVHEVNRAEVLNLPPVDMMQATALAFSTAATELLFRTIPRNDQPGAADMAQALMDTMAEYISAAITTNFGPGTQPPAPAPAQH